MASADCDVEPGAMSGLLNVLPALDGAIAQVCSKRNLRMLVSNKHSATK